MKRRDWLVQLRMAKGLTQEQVAKMAAIERSTYTKVENGASLRVGTAKKIAAVLGFHWALFFDDECDENAQPHLVLKTDYRLKEHSGVTENAFYTRI